MKKFTKIMLIIAVSLLGAGLIFCGVSTAMGASVWRMAKNGELRYGNWHIGPVGLYYSSADGDDEEDGGRHAALGQRGGERSKLCLEGKNDGLLQKMWCIDR